MSVSYFKSQPLQYYEWCGSTPIKIQMHICRNGTQIILDSQWNP